jgi:hypothetical protein
MGAPKAWTPIFGDPYNNISAPKPWTPILGDPYNLRGAPKPSISVLGVAFDPKEFSVHKQSHFDEKSPLKMRSCYCMSVMLPLTKMISPKRRKKFHKKNVYSLYSPSQ